MALQSENFIQLSGGWADIVHFLVCVAGALLCVYIMQAVMTVNTRLIHLQRLTLGILAASLMTSGMQVWSWFPQNYAQPVSLFIDIAILLVLIVMAVRGHMIIGARALQEAVDEAVGPRVGRVVQTQKIRAAPSFIETVVGWLRAGHSHNHNRGV
jgi:hypothetical protein